MNLIYPVDIPPKQATYSVRQPLEQEALGAEERLEGAKAKPLNIFRGLGSSRETFLRPPSRRAYSLKLPSPESQYLASLDVCHRGINDQRVLASDTMTTAILSQEELVFSLVFPACLSLELVLGVEWAKPCFRAD